MSQSGIWMHKGGAALSACNALLRHLFLILFLSVIAISTVVDPLAQVAVTMDAEDIGERVAALGDGDGDDAPALLLTRSATKPLPLRAERIKDALTHRSLRDVDFQFSARGPPV